MFRKMLVLMGVVWGVVAIVVADEIHVPGNYATIQEAVNAAQDGDSILVAPGEYEGVHVIDSPNNISLIGSGAFCDNPTTLTSIATSDSSVCIWLSNVTGWYLSDLKITETYMGSLYHRGGIRVNGTQNTILERIHIAEIYSTTASAIWMPYNQNLQILHSLFSDGHFDVIRVDGGTDYYFRNLTVSGNVSGVNGICVRGTITGDFILENCIVAFNGDDGIEFTASWQPYYVVQYNDSYGNSGPNFSGFIPDPTNISLDPLFAGGTGWEAYQLTENSPCIDAGNPNSPLDPDGTIADMGCFYYNQEPPPYDIDVELTYNGGSPVPPRGGNLVFDISVENFEAFSVYFDFWIAVEYEGGSPVTLALRNLTYPAGQSAYRPNMRWPIPEFWVAGNYMFWGRVGYEPDQIWDESGFPFEKLGTSEGVAFTPWMPEGTPNPLDELFGELGGGITPSLPEEFALLGAYPNPFNPTTTISFDLPMASSVDLKVFDIYGRNVGAQRAAPRWYKPGTHQINFDGSNLASGVYIYSLTAGNFTASGKMVLMK